MTRVITAMLVPLASIGTPNHRSSLTGRLWQAVDTVDTDSHLTALAQLLPGALFGSFLAVTSRPVIDDGVAGLRCRSLLDSLPARDVVLSDRWGVWKSHIAVHDDVGTAVRDSVRTHDYCVAKVDGYYDEHAEEYLRDHRPDGRMVTVIDYDTESYIAIARAAADTVVLRFDRHRFEHAVRSHLIHSPADPDALHHLHLGQDARATTASGRVEDDAEIVVAAYLREQIDLPAKLVRHRERLARDLRQGRSIGLDLDGYAQLGNSRVVAQRVARAEAAMIEAHRFAPGAWRRVLGDPTPFLSALADAATSWQRFDLICSAGMARRHIRVDGMFTAYERVIAAESRVADIAAGGDLRSVRGLQPWMQPR